MRAIQVLTHIDKSSCEGATKEEGLGVNFRETPFVKPQISQAQKYAKEHVFNEGGKSQNHQNQFVFMYLRIFIQTLAVR